MMMMMMTVLHVIIHGAAILALRIFLIVGFQALWGERVKLFVAFSKAVMLTFYSRQKSPLKLSFQKL